MQTIQLFPALTQEPAKLRDFLEKEAGQKHVTSFSKRQLTCQPRQRDSGSASMAPRNQPRNHQQQWYRAPLCISSQQASLGDSISLANSLSSSSLLTGSSGGRWTTSATTTATPTAKDEGAGDASLSATSKKMMGSLSASVYDELRPFREAHRALIRNRMASKSADGYSTPSGRVAGGSKSASRAREKSPLEAGLAKVTQCASSFAWMLGKQCIRGFQRIEMLPTVFREQLQMALHIYLRPLEGAAVADFFDIERIGSVNGEYFVRWFLHAGNSSRQQRLRAQADQQHEEMAMHRETKRETRARRDAANRAATAVSFSREDLTAALFVLGKIAFSYHNQRTGREAAQRDFTCSLAPIDFRHQLCRSFGIRLTDRQFAALFRAMDIDQNGYVDGGEFLRFFFGLCNGERAKEQRTLQVHCRIRKRNLRLDKLPPISPVLGR